MEYKYTPFITKLEPNEIFVFGSNLEGKHGKGAALTAKQNFGAKNGIGKGLTGRCYAFPTVKKLYSYTVLSLKDISDEVLELGFIIEEFPSLTFLVTEVGCGLAGYSVEQIAPLFERLKKYDNVTFPKSFWDVWNNK